MTAATETMIMNSTNGANDTDKLIWVTTACRSWYGVLWICASTYMFQRTPIWVLTRREIILPCKMFPEILTQEWHKLRYCAQQSHCYTLLKNGSCQQINLITKACLHWRFLLRFFCDFKGDFTAISNRPCKLLAILRQFESPVVYMGDLKSLQNHTWNHSKNRR